MDEQDAARESLRQFGEFAQQCHLDDRNTLIILSQFNTSNYEQQIEGFVRLQKHITALSPDERTEPGMLPEATIDEPLNDAQRFLFAGNDRDDEDEQYATSL